MPGDGLKKRSKRDYFQKLDLRKYFSLCSPSMTRRRLHQPKSLNLKFFFFEKTVLGGSSYREILNVYDVIKLRNELTKFLRFVYEIPFLLQNH